MRLTFRSWKGTRYVSLAEILLIIGRFAVDLELRWYTRLIEVAPGPGAETLEALDASRGMNIFELLHLVTPDIQIIDGEVIARREDRGSGPSLVIRAVDSTFWDIETDVTCVIETLREAYPEAKETTNL